MADDTSEGNLVKVVALCNIRTEYPEGSGNVINIKKGTVFMMDAEKASKRTHTVKVVPNPPALDLSPKEDSDEVNADGESSEVSTETPQDEVPEKAESTDIVQDEVPETTESTDAGDVEKNTTETKTTRTSGKKQQQ